MKILYNSTSSDYIFPLSKEEVSQIKKLLPFDTLNKIRSIEFGCNRKTTQEGRIVQRGQIYDIRVNFCLKDNQSILLSDKITYLDQIRKFSGAVNLSTRTIEWQIKNAKLYAFYLIFHEIGHIVYCEQQSSAHFKIVSSGKEEQWCDHYAMQKISEMACCDSK